MANEIGHVRLRSEAERIKRLGLPERHTVEYAKAIGIDMAPPMPANPNRHSRRAFAKRLDAWARAERRALDAYEKEQG